MEQGFALRRTIAKIVSQDNVAAMEKWRADIRRWMKAYPDGSVIEQIKDFPAEPTFTDLYALFFAMAYSSESGNYGYMPLAARPKMYHKGTYEGNQYSLNSNLLIGLIQTSREHVTPKWATADCTIFFYPRRLLTMFRNALPFFMVEGQMVYNDYYGMIAFGFEAKRPGIIHTDFPKEAPMVYWNKEMVLGGTALSHYTYGDATLIPPRGSVQAQEAFLNEFCVVAVLRKSPPKKGSKQPDAYDSLRIAMFAAEKSLEEYGQTQRSLPTDYAVDEIFRQVIADPLEKLGPQEDDWDKPEVSEESMQRKALAEKLQTRTVPAIVVTPPPAAEPAPSVYQSLPAEAMQRKPEVVVFSQPAAVEPVQSVYQSLPAEAMSQGIVLPPPPPSGPVELPPPPPPPATAEPAQAPYQSLPAEAMRPSPTPTYGPLPQDEEATYGVLPERRKDIYGGFPQDIEEEEILKLPAPKTLAEVKAFRKPWPGAETRIDQDILHTALQEARRGKIRSAPSQQTEIALGKVIAKTNTVYGERMADLPPMARNSPDTRSEVYHQSLIAVNEPWGFTEACWMQSLYFEDGTYGDVVFDKPVSEHQPRALAHLSALGMLVVDQNTQGDLDAKDYSREHATLGREYVAAVMDATVALTFVQYLPDSVNFRIMLNDGGVDERVDIDPVLSGSAECLTMVVYGSMEIDDWRYIESIGRQPNILVEKNLALCVFWTRLFRDPNLVNELVNALARTCAENVMDVSPPQATAEEAVLFSAPASVAPVVAFSAPAVSVVESKSAQVISASVVPAKSAPKTKAKTAPAPKKSKSAPKRTRTTAKTEKQKAEEKAKKWWTNHPGGKTRDKSVTAKKVVTKAAEYEPSKNDFRGVDTKSKK